jgi:hydrogenase-4 component E
MHEGVLSFEAASAAIDVAALGLIALALFGTVVRRLEGAILLLALQGAMLGIASGAAALAEMQWRAWAAFTVAVAVKAIAIPIMLRIVLGRLVVRHELETVIGTKLAFPIAAALVPLSYRAIHPFTEAEGHGFDAPNALPAAMALLLLGLFTMTIRKKALTQVIGLVTMENGLYLAAVAATRGLPFTVEFGVAIDVLTGVAVMGLVMHEINREFGTLNTDRLRSLRG